MTGDTSNVLFVAKSATAQGQAEPQRTWLVDRRRDAWTGPRYSRFVSAMKILLSALALVLVAALIGYSALYKTPADLLGTEGFFKIVGEHIEMNKPVLNFTDKENRAYTVRAKTATQLPESANLWQLAAIDAVMTPQDGAPVHLTSREGKLDSERQLLDLAGDVLLTTDDGRRFEAMSAHVDFGTGAVSSAEPVKAFSSGGIITSDRFQLEESGNKIRFEGNVRFKTTPKASKAPAG